MKRILVPTDFSEEANNALDGAIQLAKMGGGEILLLHVIESTENQSFNEMGEISHSNPENKLFILQMMKVAKGKMSKIKSDHQDLTIIDMVKVGHPFHNISETIVDEKVDIVIMGSRGTSGMEEILVGSNAERVVRYAKCPVITIKHSIDFSGIKTIAFASDLSTSQNNTVQQLQVLQRLLDAKLKIVKVNTHSDWVTDRELNTLLARFVSENKIENFDFTSYNARYIEDGIIHFAEDKEVDMIAMATHGRTGFAHVIAGSVAEDLVNHSKRPIWTCSIKN